MKEHEEINFKFLIRFYNSKKEIISAIEEYKRQNPDATKSQIFNGLVNGKGHGKAHHIYREETIRPRSISGTKRKNRKKW